MDTRQREMDHLFGGLPAAWRWPLPGEYPPLNIARADSTLTVETEGRPICLRARA